MIGFFILLGIVILCSILFGFFLGFDDGSLLIAPMIVVLFMTFGMIIYINDFTSRKVMVNVNGSSYNYVFTDEQLQQFRNEIVDSLKNDLDKAVQNENNWRNKIGF